MIFFPVPPDPAERFLYQERFPQAFRHNFYICTIFQKIWCKTITSSPGFKTVFRITFSPLAAPTVMIRFSQKNLSQTAVQGLRNGFTHILKSCVIHIPVKNYRILIICQINNGFPNTVRRGNAGISQAEIIYFICSVLFFRRFPSSNIVRIAELF